MWGGRMWVCAYVVFFLLFNKLMFTWLCFAQTIVMICVNEGGGGVGAVGRH